MSLHFVLDGYNILGRLTKDNPKKLSDSRRKLYDFILSNQPQGSPNNKISIFFDGKDGFSTQDKISGLEVIFSKEVSADELIKEFVKDSHSPKTIVVVTDDRDIQISARRALAKVMPVEEFLSRKKTNTAKKYSIGNNLSITQADEITKEMKRHWLK
jgi:predicted RNA-binding protein with PIN domain